VERGRHGKEFKCGMRNWECGMTGWGARISAGAEGCQRGGRDVQTGATSFTARVLCVHRIVLFGRHC
jgi:hypothetical protein